MDNVTFRSDTVLSDVHLRTSSKRHFMVRLNTVGQPVFLSQFRLFLDENNQDSENEQILRKKKHKEPDKDGKELYAEKATDDQNTPNRIEKEKDSLKGFEAILDEDGDLEVVRKPCLPDSEREDLLRDKVCPVILTRGGDVLENQDQENSGWDTLQIEHTMATPLEDVGKQVWRGGFLLADFVLSQCDLFKDCTVLELGAGTGIVSIIVSKAAKTVYCTDVGEDLLGMCERNIALNKNLTDQGNKGSKVKVRTLDWLKDDFCTDPDSSYSWSEKEIADLHDCTTVILAADVFYDDSLTDAFFKTLYRITSNLKNPSTIYLSTEKRFNFTLRHMDIVCEAYNHFLRTLNDLVDIRDGRMRYTVEPLQLCFPQHILYERVEQLELWKITAEMATETRAPSSA